MTLQVVARQWSSSLDDLMTSSRVSVLFATILTDTGDASPLIGEHFRTNPRPSVPNILRKIFEGVKPEARILEQALALMAAVSTQLQHENIERTTDPSLLFLWPLVCQLLFELQRRDDEDEAIVALIQAARRCTALWEQGICRLETTILERPCRSVPSILTLATRLLFSSNDNKQELFALLETLIDARFFDFIEEHISVFLTIPETPGRLCPLKAVVFDVEHLPIPQRAFTSSLTVWPALLAWSHLITVHSTPNSAGCFLDSK